MIILCGKKRVGKNLVAKRLVKSYGYKEIAFADSLKHITRDILYVNSGKKLTKDYFWTDKKCLPVEGGYSVRYYLQRYGSILRSHSPSFFINIVKSKVKVDQKVVITDCRFENELKAFPGAISILINRNTGLKDDHESELIDFKTNLMLDNNGTILDLYDKVDAIMNKLKKEKI